MTYFISFYNPGESFWANWDPRGTKRTGWLGFPPNIVGAQPCCLSLHQKGAVFVSSWQSTQGISIATVERGPSEGACSGSIGPTWVFSGSASCLHLSLREWPRLPSTARIERGPS